MVDGIFGNAHTLVGDDRGIHYLRRHCHRGTLHGGNGGRLDARVGGGSGSGGGGMRRRRGGNRDRRGTIRWTVRPTHGQHLIELLANEFQGPRFW